MFSDSTIKKSLKLGLVSLLAVAANVMTMPIAQAEQPDEWTLKVKTEELKRQFVYKGTKLNPVAKVQVGYKKSKDPGEPKKFELIYCHDGKPIGLEREGPYLVKRGEIVDIDVEQKQHSEEENKAVGFTLMRLGLVAYHHSNPIVAVTVPTQSFDGVVDALREWKCEEFVGKADRASGDGIMFKLESEPPGREQRMHFKITKP